MIWRRATQKQTAEASHRSRAQTSTQSRAPVDPLLQLHQTIGNQAVQRLLRAHAIQAKLAISQPGDIYEQEADRVADRVMRMPQPIIQRTCSACAAGGSLCSECETEDEAPLLRKTEQPADSRDSVPDDFIRNLGPGKSLDAATRAFFEPRFGCDFGGVRVHADGKAAASARSVNASAYTVGRHVILGGGQYAPGTDGGNRLLAHELTHVLQQRAGRVARLQRTPARKVSCANNVPLHVPGANVVDIADPVAVITAAEDRANQMFDDVISELDFTRQAILAGAPVGWPTISDAVGEGLRLMGLDPDDRAIWVAPSGTGQRSVPLLLRRLRLIRGTIGDGSFFFFCLGTGMTKIGTCSPPAGDADICTNAVAATCSGEFFTAFCPTFWTNSAEDQAARIVHESAHNFATFIGHTGRFTNAECFARLIQVFAGVPEADQRVDLCPNP
jgi:hypothetical protein